MPASLDDLDLTAALDPDSFDTRKAELEEALARVHRLAVENDLPVLVIVDGWNYTGKARMVQFISAPMDPRGFKVATWLAPTRDDREYPPVRRYIERMPRRGEVAFFIRSYYSQELERRVAGVPPRWHRIKWSRVRAMEDALAADGTVIVKLWLHLDAGELARRRREEPHDPQWSPVVDAKQDRRYKKYDRALRRMIDQTDTPAAPWTLIAATDLGHARVAAATEVVRRIETALAAREEAVAPEVPSRPPRDPAAARLKEADLSPDDPEDYKERLDRLQDELSAAQYECVLEGRPVVVAFEGWDASGKGGAIRRLRVKLNPCHYDVHSIAAPDSNELRHHYLWRFWRRLPRAGRWSVFDRSWYGRVLVERVEELISPAAWDRAYDEINRFEDDVVSSGAVLVKIWLHISPEEQLRRFEERQKTPHKKYKIGEDDWRNRKKWDAYVVAAEEMFARTDCPGASWTIVGGNNKKRARLAVLETVLKAVQR